MNINERYKEITSSVKMTEPEKGAMKATLLWHIRSNNKPVKTPFYLMPWVRSGLAFVAVCVLSGTGIVFASKDALPGNITYPVKIQIEEIKGVTKTTPSQKIIYNKKRAENRLSEIKVMLAKQDDINPEKIAIASKSFEDHIKKAKDNAILVSENSGSDEQKEALLAVKRLEENLEKDVRVLTALSTDKNIDQTILPALMSKNKESVTDAVRQIASPKQSETDNLKIEISNVNISIEDLPAGIGDYMPEGSDIIETTRQPE